MQGYIEPFKIFGNLYFVGFECASTHIVDTGDGLIMFDSGYHHLLPDMLANMRGIGLNPMDVKYIFHTHGHIDHLGATKELVGLTNAKTFIGEEDKDYANGTLDLTYAKELGMEYTEAFEPDFLLKNGDVVKLGNTTVKALATPGHTPGAMSYFFDVTDGQKTYRAALSGGSGINTLSLKFIDKYGLPHDLRDRFIAVMDKLKSEKVDIFLGNHTFQNNTVAKREKLLMGETEAFVNSSEWEEYLERSKQDVIKLMNEEEDDK